MVNRLLIAGWGFIVCLLPSPPGHTESFDQLHQAGRAGNYAFINGQWLNGQGFSKDTWYAVQGRFTRSKPLSVDHTIDLGEGYVVPPFGEAHTHNVEGSWNIDTVIKNYVRDGIFYVKNPNDIHEFVEDIREKFNTPGTIDVAFAHAGLTGQNGHPVDLYEDILRVHRYEPVIGKREKGWFNGRAYFLIATLTDLEDRWPAIMATKPDFVKVYLADSEHFGTNTPSTHRGFRKGLNPRLIRPIVQIAHQQGLRVSAHIETAADFRVALEGGVDEIAHVPGWFLPSSSQREAVLLTQEDAQQAAKQQTVIVTTTVAGHRHPDQDDPLRSSSRPTKGHEQAHSESLRDAAREVQTRNLTLLHQAGVTIAIGSDHAETALAETLHLHDLGVFDNLTLLKMWCVTTPQTIFPSRKLGQFEEGYEASFLVLQDNPLEDFEHVQNISLRFKQGVFLSTPTP
jgi:hypothetical protein